MSIKPKRNTVDVVRGLACLIEPDSSGDRCYECAYDCKDPEKARDRILRDALSILQYSTGTPDPLKRRNHGKK